MKRERFSVDEVWLSYEAGLLYYRKRFRMKKDVLPIIKDALCALLRERMELLLHEEGYATLRV